MPHLFHQPPERREADAPAQGLPVRGVIDHAAAALKAAIRVDEPFPHWLLRDVLPDALCREIVALQMAPPPPEDTKGKRDSHNDQRQFAAGSNLQRHPSLAAVATAFQSPSVVKAIEDAFGIDCAGSYLRIEVLPGLRWVLAGTAYGHQGKAAHLAAVSEYRC